MATVDPEMLNSVAYYIDFRNDVFLIRGKIELYSTMLQNEINAEFRVRDGAHTLYYWRTALPNVHEFVSNRFNRYPY